MENHRLKFVPVLAAILTLVVAGPGLLAAQHEEVPAEATAQQHEGEAHESEGHRHKNHLGLFLGITDEEAASEFTIGLDYERRFSRWFGIGVLVESIAGDAREVIVGIPVFLHATERLKFLLAAGYESLGPFENDKGHHDDRETVVRIGAEYAFHFGNYSVSPALNVDFVDSEEILVYGVTIGRGW